MTDLSLVHVSRPATVGQAPYPTLILLHGLGSNELDMHMLAGQLDPRVFAISVRAPHLLPWGGYAWYDLAEGAGLGGPGIEASLAALWRFLQEALDDFPVDPNRLFLGGFSMGAAMAGAMAMLQPDRIAGAVMISGYLPPPSPEHGYDRSGAAGHPFFQAHGTVDTVVSVEFARQTRDFLEQSGVELTYHEYPIGHEVSLPELQDLATWLDAAMLSVPERSR